MSKTLTYPTFLIATLLVILLFITSKSYPQLAFAAMFYMAVIFLAFQIFPRTAHRLKTGAFQPRLMFNPEKSARQKPKVESAYVTDIDRRAFIKLIGATSLSVLVFSLLGRKLETLIFARNTGSYPSPSKQNDQFGLSGPSLTDGYKISEIDEGLVSYYGFTNQEGAWLIMRGDEEGTSFRYARGNSGFPGNWANRESLVYDYFYNLF